MPDDRDGKPSIGANGSAVLTVPNLLSLARIAAIPPLVWAIVHHGSEAAGLIGFAIVASTDWLDGYIARRTGAVSRLGKLLDPVADRLVVVGVVAALVVRDALPVWAAALVVARDVALLLVGAAALWARGVRIDVRPIGKAATFALMLGIPLIAWGAFDLPLAGAATVGGWAAYAVGIALAYVAAGRYSVDLRRALSADAGT